jgi:nitroreductase
MAEIRGQGKDLIGFLRGLRAVREYTSEPVSDEALNDILEVGRWSGSASNRQTTQIVVVKDAATKQQITDKGVRAAAGSAVSLVILIPDDAAQSNLDSFDNGRLVERLLLAAHAHGLGANIGTLKGDGPEVIKGTLGVPEGLRAWTVVTIGHIDQEARKARQPSSNAGRKPSDSFVHWDHY